MSVAQMLSYITDQRPVNYILSTVTL